MAKYYGAIGFGETVESKPGVWNEQITERNYYGDVLRLSRRFQSTSNVNDDVNYSNQLSIVADPYALTHFQNIRYAVWMGAKWKISNIEVAYPRLILDVGGVYNGPTGAQA